MAMDSGERLRRLRGLPQETRPQEKGAPNLEEKSVFVKEPMVKESSDLLHPFHSPVALDPSEFRRELGPLKILVALDEWALETGLLDCAKILSEMDPAQLLFFHVQEVREGPLKIIDWNSELKKQGLQGTVRTVGHLSPEQAIRETARQESCSLILAATHSRLGKERVLKGSVAEGLLKQAECSVLIHKPGTDWKQLHRVLLPFQDSATLHKVLPAAVKLCRSFKADLWLFHVSPKGQEPSFLEENSFKRFFGQFPFKEPASIFAEGRGSVPEVIAEFSRQQEINLLVLATHHEDLQSKLLSASTASQVLREVPCGLWGIPV